MPNKNITQLQKMKLNNEKIAMCTAYDATFAQCISEAGMDIILVGDSLGMVIQGKQSTVHVSIEDMCYHTSNIAQINTQCFILSDLPFATYATPYDALIHSAQLIKSGAHMVKLEGGRQLKESITLLVNNGIPVCAHLGLTPQHVNTFGGYKVQGKGNAGDKLIEDALILEQAGAQMILVECIPADLTKRLTAQLRIPVIGIGAGIHCDGQVLVMHDLLGLSKHTPKFVKKYMPEHGSIQQAFKAYVDEVKNLGFPTEIHSF